VIVERILASSGFEGFDATSRQFVDLDTAGIIDPTKVVRAALENAVSVAGVMLLAEATMVELEEIESPAPAEHEFM
jgi:chaperonin GroEL